MKKNEFDVTPWYMKLHNLTGAKTVKVVKDKRTGKERTIEKWRNK